MKSKHQDNVQPVRGRLLKFREAAAYLGFINADGSLDEQHLRRLVARKKIPVIRDGRLGFYERDLDEWIAEHRAPASGPTPLRLPPVGRVVLDDDTGIEGLLRDIQRRGGSPFDQMHHDRTASGKPVKKTPRRTRQG